ncbi:MAG: DNA double-strand break repair nuclease NurA [Candidatus Bathyarchaeota archaeon]
MAEELIEWVKLPQDLQHRFFELAWGEAEKLTETVQQLNQQLKDLKEKLQPYIETLPSSDKTLTVAAVDSSRSPVLSERLGVRYGVFATGIVLVKGVEKRKEDFGAGVFKRKQAFSTDKSRHFFNLLTTYTERKMALEALNQCDLLILDGSFYSFVYGALRMKKSGLYGDYEDKVLRKTFEATETLRKSGKVIGVVKRSHTRAIGGYLALKHEDKLFTTIIDKLILSTLMPEKSVFSYRKILGETPTPIYTTTAELLTSKKHGSKDVVMEAEERVYAPFETLKLEKQGFKEMRRIQVKYHKDLPPCEIEYPSSIREDEFLKMLGQKNFFNEATNLPIALDLVDNAVSLSAKFTEEFVSEVEGRVLEEIAKNMENQNIVKTFFTLLNPQKQY